MLPAKCKLLKCPYCGKEKEVLSIASGNTFRGKRWSDTKVFYPMLPTVSPIQKCPSCGKYYFKANVKSRMGDDYSFDKGELTYEELKEAALQFEGEERISKDNRQTLLFYLRHIWQQNRKISKDNRKTLLFELMWAYNDKYNREEMDIVEPSDEERCYFETVVKEIMESYELPDVFRAELYRERGMFEEALEILKTCSPSEDYMIAIVEKMKLYAENKSRMAFLHTEDKNKYDRKVRYEDIVNGVKDEFGCIYSLDRKRLLQGAEDLLYYTIKDSVEVICDNAFMHCSLLEKVSLPESVKLIGDTPFTKYTKVESLSKRFVVEDDFLIDLHTGRLIHYLDNGKTDITIPELVKWIGNAAFMECNSLENVVMPNTVKVIGDMAFGGCTSLKNIVLSNSLERIERNAFLFCLSLKSIVLPERLSFIGVPNFDRGLDIISLSKHFVVEDGLIIDKDNNKLIICTSNHTEVYIPSTVTSIGRVAFWGCMSLQTIVLPNSLETIEESAFIGCRYLQNIFIPQGKREYFEELL